MWIKPKTVGYISCLVGGASFLPSCEEKKVEVPHMNVIYILADDLGYGDIEPYGQMKIHTPNINRLRDRGMRFTQCYAGATVSAPSRCSLMTGLHTGHTFVRGNKRAFPDRLAYAPGSTLEGQVAMPKGTFTIASMFKEQGYTTGCFGKWGLGYPGSDSDPLMVGFDQFFGFNCQTLAHDYYPDHLWNGMRRIELPQNEQDGRVTYSADTIHQEAMTFLRENANHPFFAYLSYTIPHAEMAVPHDSVYERYCNEIPAEDEVPYIAWANRRVGQYHTSERPLATFAAMVTRLDRYVGEVMDMVDSLGIADNTLIILTSDNGPHREGGANPDYFRSYGPYRGLKRDLYEGGIHMPMIMSCPGRVAQGVDNDHIMAFWDFMPTFAQLCGYDKPLKTDGISILPTLFGEGEQIKHDYLYWEHHEKDGKQAIREGKWKGIRMHVESDSPYFELYDLSVDPHEDNNVADKYPEIVGHLQQLIDHCHIDSDLFNFGR